MNGQLLKVLSPLVSTVRAKGYKAPGGIRYPGGIVYYPRYPDHKDPEYTPTKLFRVERIKPSKHQPHYLKSILREFNILEECENHVTVVKNIPEINMRLWKIKHLIKITPIVFPYGEPTKDDINYTVLKENGQCIVTKTIGPKPEQIEALEQFEKSEKKMDSDTLKKDSRYKWNNAFNGGF
ncbi:unnamed protein product [Spodoptera exigua]|uniref:39S ribosomal protein L30, mitochondrial n=1 Tax=Spodoptera exigua TaxID=7107 RepID=A0A835G617_SPOEX|nr:hypothetical protein HW555_012361 [Spodoptera exigua]KAH9645819.1 hypothetical protein HF086_012546 [Spodoptera exigua]CAH0699238.1 unnamed protein product [Spodoptera exigua]